MLINIVYLLIALILIYVIYIAVKAINTGMEAKKANKNSEIINEIVPNNQEDIVKSLTELKELHEKKILSDEEFAIAKKKILDE